MRSEDFKSEPETQHDACHSEISEVADTASGTIEHGGPGGSAGVGQADVVEQALAEALLRASRDGAHDVVKVLVDELRARRAARAGVVDLDAARAKRQK